MVLFWVFTRIGKGGCFYWAWGGMGVEKVGEVLMAKNTKFVKSRLYAHLVRRNGVIVYLSGFFAKDGRGVDCLVKRPHFRLVRRSVVGPF